MSISLVDSDGDKIAVDVAGEGPLVICSPGIGDFRNAFAPFAAHLVAAEYRVARMDLRGHGDSNTVFDRYGDEPIAVDYLAVMDALGGGPTVLAGASISAAGAVIAAGRRPDQVSGLILLGPYVRNGAGTFMRGLLHVALTRPWGPSVWRMYAASLWPALGQGAKERAARSAASLTRPGALARVPRHLRRQPRCRRALDRSGPCAGPGRDGRCGPRLEGPGGGSGLGRVQLRRRGGGPGARRRTRADAGAPSCRRSGRF